MVSFGIDEWSVNLLCGYFMAYSTNWGNLVTDDFKDVVGKPARSITDFGRDFSTAFVYHQQRFLAHNPGMYTYS